MVQGSDGASVIRAHQLIDDVISNFNSWLSNFFKGHWVRSIVEERMTKAAYIRSLNEFYNAIHQSVETLAACNELGDCSVFLEEVQSKQRILINDFNYLGVSVPTIQKINQENQSTLILSCLKLWVIGGVVANMDRMLMKHLGCVVASWGIVNPDCVTRYVARLSRYQNYRQTLDELVNRLSLNQHPSKIVLHELNMAMHQVEQTFNAIVHPVQSKLEGVIHVE